MNRRSVIMNTAVSVASLASATAVVAPATACNRFTELTARWRANVASWRERNQLYTSVMDEADRVLPPPEVLRFTPSDVALGFDPPLPVGSTHYTLTVYMFEGEVSSEDDSDDVRCAKQMRATEVLTAQREWKESRAAITSSLGYDAAEWEAATDVLSDEQNEIEEAPVTTLAEAIAKAQLIAEVLRHYDEAAADLDLPSEEPQIVMARNLVLAIAELSAA
jgi:hypothetical protein